MKVQTSCGALLEVNGFLCFPCFFHHNESKWGLPMPENRAFR